MARMQARCRSGEHDLTLPENLTADGRACRPCRRKSQRTWVADQRAAAKESGPSCIAPGGRDPADRNLPLDEALTLADGISAAAGVARCARPWPPSLADVLIAACQRPAGHPGPHRHCPPGGVAAVQWTDRIDVAEAERRAVNAELVDDLEPVARALAAAVHARDPERVAALVAGCERLDVVAIILAALLPREPRTGADGTEVRCGTAEGWREHRRHDEPPCLACRGEHDRIAAALRESARGEHAERAHWYRRHSA